MAAEENDTTALDQVTDAGDSTENPDQTTGAETAGSTTLAGDAADDGRAGSQDAEDTSADGDATAEEDDESDDDAEDSGAESGSGRGRQKSKKQTALDEEGDVAADYLEELLDIADLDGDIDTYTEGGRAHVSIVTEADLLVGKNGEVLEALQELARLAVMTETGHRSRLMLDVAGHRDKRRTELTDLANDAIEEARSSGEEVRLSPMNPFERKIVHDVVATAGLTSESAGEEPNRRVVVLPS